MVTFAGRKMHYIGIHHKPQRRGKHTRTYGYGFPGYALLIDEQTGKEVRARLDRVFLTD